MVLRSAVVVLLMGLCASTVAVSQRIGGDVSMDEYLMLLGQVDPAARDGAEAFREAFRRNCKREISTLELRRAVAEGDGDPVLMGMMRASHQRDQSELLRLASQVRCSTGP